MESIQFCPKCKSKNVRESTLIPMGDPIKAQGFTGYECLDCGYVGKDFLILSEKEYSKFLKKKKKSSKRN
jgi:predicted nucleic-acid-binding Zn-ribbon protein